jgi:hypothetical protein
MDPNSEPLGCFWFSSRDKDDRFDWHRLQGAYVLAAKSTAEVTEKYDGERSCA